MTVYFIKAEGTDLIKIGCVKNLGNLWPRLRQLRTMSPVPLTLLGVIDKEVECFYGPEHWIHRHMSHLYSHGEWYRISPELLNYIEENAIAIDEAAFSAQRKKCEGLRRSGNGRCGNWASEGSEYCHHHQSESR